MELMVEAPKRIEDGAYDGLIVDIKEKLIQYRGKQIRLIDVTFEFGDDQRITKGYWDKVTVESELGKLLMEFGGALEEGKLIDPERILKNMTCKFMILRNKDNYAEVVKGSVKAK